MEAIIQYIYTGETYIAKDDLFSFLNTANLLQIIGLINYNIYNSKTSQQNGTFDHRSQSEFVSQTKPHPASTPSPKSNILVKKFANKTDDSVLLRKSASPTEQSPTAPKKRNNQGSSEGEQSVEVPVSVQEESCPILSKQLLLPKKRKLSVVDQNKNEFYDNSELSNSSEDIKENGTILRNCLEDKPENELETDDEINFPAAITIKKEAVESEENVLEPEVGLCVKEEQEFESTSEESLNNGDILLQRLQAFQGTCIFFYSVIHLMLSC